MTQAFASVANRGVAVTPYAITKVVTVNGRELYRHEPQEQRVLVAPWVAAEMTDLLQSAVLSGTGRAAQIGRPVACKTGTTSSNKDGWFLGFSSGLTTGVWMGRDDAKRVAGLAGGSAPARAFHDFMSVAVANRPVQQFETQVPLPDWQLTPEEEMYGDEAPDMNDIGPMMVDENGMPIMTPPPGMGFPQQQPMIQPDGSGPPTQQELDQAFPPQPGQQPQQQPQQPQQQQPAVRRPPGYVPPPQPRQPPPRQPADPTQPQLRSIAPPDSPEARSYTP
jgi:penicillin-binding protein 1A